MPEGRFMNKSISQNEVLGSVSVEAALLFSWCIPHLDRDGRIDGHPVLLRSKLFPWRQDITAESIPSLIAELAPLVRWYEVDGKAVLYFPGFRDEQKGDAWYKKEAASRLPAYSEAALDLLQSNSRPTPDPLQPNVMECNAIRSKFGLLTSFINRRAPNCG